MARIRTIKPEFWQDEKMSLCDPLTRLVFLGLVSLADDCGRIVDNLRYIDAQLFMNTSDSALEPLRRLAGMGRIKRGLTASAQPVIEICNWKRHQRISHPNLKGSLPELVTLQGVALLPEPFRNDSGAIPEPLRHHTNDQRPTTNDLRPTSSSLAVASRTTPGATATATAVREAEPLTGAVRSLHETAPTLAVADNTTQTHQPTLLDIARLLAAAANRGISEKYGEQVMPLVASNGTSHSAAEAIVKAGVDPVFAASAMFECARTLTLERPPRSLGYFVQAATDRWQAHNARADAGAFVPTQPEPESTHDRNEYVARKYAQEGNAEWQEHCEQHGIVWRT